MQLSIFASMDATQPVFDSLLPIPGMCVKAIDRQMSPAASGMPNATQILLTIPTMTKSVFWLMVAPKDTRISLPKTERMIPTTAMTIPYVMSCLLSRWLFTVIPPECDWAVVGRNSFLRVGQMGQFSRQNSVP
jgi:hypothetical protein